MPIISETIIGCEAKKHLIAPLHEPNKKNGYFVRLRELFIRFVSRMYAKNAYTEIRKGETTMFNRNKPQLKLANTWQQALKNREMLKQAYHLSGNLQEAKMQLFIPEYSETSENRESELQIPRYADLLSFPSILNS